MDEKLHWLAKTPAPFIKAIGEQFNLVFAVCRDCWQPESVL